jgi:hypothetical protein
MTVVPRVEIAPPLSPTLSTNVLSVMVSVPSLVIPPTPSLCPLLENVLPLMTRVPELTIPPKVPPFPTNELSWMVSVPLLRFPRSLLRRYRRRSCHRS